MNGVLPDAPTPAPAATPQLLAAADLAPLSAAEQLRTVAVPQRDMVGLRAMLDPVVAAAATATAAAPMATPPEYAIGDTTTFFVHNSDTAENRQITAELVHKTDVAYAWVETGQEYDAKAIAASIDTFSNRIYPAAVTAFGREPFPGIDGDPRLHVLHTTGMGGAAGYFLSGDEISRLGYPYSNQKEMFYISLDWMNMMKDPQTYETVLAHEFQHMIHSAHDANEEVWINEGLSEYAQEVAGYPADLGFASTYIMLPDTQLNTWGGANENNSAHYGASYLFVRYLVQRFGPPIVQAIVDEPANGIEGVRRVLAHYDASFDEVFADWLVAVALESAQRACGRWALWLHRLCPDAALLDSRDRFPGHPDRGACRQFHRQHAQFGPIRGDYPHIRRRHHHNRLCAGAACGTRAWWSNRSDMSEARLTRVFDLTSVEASTPLTLSVRTAWDIEPSYDYGYVMASRDGAAWSILPGQRTTQLNTAGNNLGTGYTGLSDADPASGGWVTETFDLAEYAGGPLHLRFSYVTDDAVTRPGWWIDDVRINGIGYVEDFEGDAPGWLSEGWLLTDGVLPQEWLLQVLTLDNGVLVDVQRPVVDAAGDATIPIAAPGSQRATTVLISPITEGATQEAAFRYAVEAAPIAP